MGMEFVKYWYNDLLLYQATEIRNPTLTICMVYSNKQGFGVYLVNRWVQGCSSFGGSIHPWWTL